MEHDSDPAQIETSGLDLSPLFDTAKAPPGSEGGFAGWQTIIWREWCRSNDEDYAYYLFELVKSTTFGRRFILLAAALGVLAGGLAGFLISSAITAPIQIGAWDLSQWPVWILTWSMAIAGGLIGLEGSRRFRYWYFWWRGQPSASRVESALRHAVAFYPEARRVWAKPLRLLELQKASPANPAQLIAGLDDPDWVTRFAARHALIDLGGEATEALQKVAADRSNPLWQVAIWLLTTIEQETANQYAWRVNDTVCPRCLTRFGKRSVDLSLGIPFTYFGCRLCGQSREYLYVPQGVVAVLNSRWSEAQSHKDGLLRVNWLERRAPFDFDWVEIAHATDEEVERFAVQLGNDTDPVRRQRYAQLRCFIGSECRLSENTLRILRRMLGQVEQIRQLPERKQGQVSGRLRQQTGTIDRQDDAPGQMKNSETTV